MQHLYRKVLQALAHPTLVKMISLPALPTYIQQWIKAKEWMALYPLAVHFGHYFAGVEDPLIAMANAIMVEIPLITRYSPCHRKKVCPYRESSGE